MRPSTRMVAMAVKALAPLQVANLRCLSHRGQASPRKEPARACAALRIAGLLTLALAPSACGAGAMLKGPIAGQCQSMGLKGCPDLADGVVLYIEGDQKKAEEKLIAAAGANTPDQILQFACVLKAINMIPGADSFMQPILKVVDLLEKSKKGEAKAEGEPGASATAGTTGNAAETPARRSCPRFPAEIVVTTAATDPTQIRAGTTSPLDDQDGVDCKRLVPGATGRCVLATPGPLVVTDLVGTAECTVFVASAAKPPDTGPPDWLLASPQSIHGARLLVGPNRWLVVGAAPSRVNTHCSLVWAGFVPYGPEPAPIAKTELD
jgi:hypothetical protein